MHEPKSVWRPLRWRQVEFFNSKREQWSALMQYVLSRPTKFAITTGEESAYKVLASAAVTTCGFTGWFAKECAGLPCAIHAVIIEFLDVDGVSLSVYFGYKQSYNICTHNIPLSEAILHVIEINRTFQRRWRQKVNRSDEM